jgi:hypothetical protein
MFLYHTLSCYSIFCHNLCPYHILSCVSILYTSFSIPTNVSILYTYFSIPPRVSNSILCLYPLFVLSYIILFLYPTNVPFHPTKCFYTIPSCASTLYTSFSIPPYVSSLSHLVSLSFIRPFLSHHMFPTYHILCLYPSYVLFYPIIWFYLSHLVPLPFMSPFLSHNMSLSYLILCLNLSYAFFPSTKCFYLIPYCVSILNASFSIPSCAPILYESFSIPPYVFLPIPSCVPILYTSFPIPPYVSIPVRRLIQCA